MKGNITMHEKVSEQIREYMTYRNEGKMHKEIYPLMGFKSIDSLKYFIKKYKVDTRIEVRCLTCNSIFRTKNTKALTCSKRCSDEYYDKNVRGQFNTCKGCNRRYMVTEGLLYYCSNECLELHKTIDDRKTNKEKRFALNGEPDWTITLAGLSKRDNNICHICDEEVDWNDYYIDNKGTYICGNKYPSIDHVVPIALGGKHQKDNVRLAHRVCNSKKGMRIITKA